MLWLPSSDCMRVPKWFCIGQVESASQSGVGILAIDLEKNNLLICFVRKDSDAVSNSVTLLGM